MAKKLMTKKTAAKKIRSMKGKEKGDDLDSYGLAALKMYDDPCGATLSETIYEGDQGFVNRFVSNFSFITGGGQTSGLCIVRPSIGVASLSAAATATDSQTVTYGDSVMPGAAFLNNNAGKIRCAGFCAIITPQSAPNTATGQIAVGVVPANVFAQASTYTADQVSSYLTEKASASQALVNPYQVKWCPGVMDDRYVSATGVTGDDDNDRNAIAIAITGLPPATGVNVRLVGIYEWSAVSNIGIAMDATATKRSRCNLACVIRNLKRKSPTWWVELGKTVGRGYLDAGLSGAAARAIRYI